MEQVRKYVKLLHHNPACNSCVRHWSSIPHQSPTPASKGISVLTILGALQGSQICFLRKNLKCKQHDNYGRTFLCPHYGTASLTSYVYNVALSAEVNMSKNVNNKKSDGPITRPVLFYTCNLCDRVDDAVTAWF
jgi:hypothetical protein